MPQQITLEQIKLVLKTQPSYQFLYRLASQYLDVHKELEDHKIIISKESSGSKELTIDFIEERFPEDISYGANGGPEYLTDIKIDQFGKENRTSNWDFGRIKYYIAPGVKTQEQLTKLIAFFRSCKGRAIGFRFKDWTDYKADQQVLGVANGVQSTFKFVKYYTNSSGYTETRRIHKIVPGSVSIFKNKLVQQSGYTVDYNKGEVTFNEPPLKGTIISADFEFDVPVRFDTDKIAATLDSYGSGCINTVPVIEIKA